jgi:diphthamide biosynthesis protein 4
VLSLATSASPAEIKAAYHRALLQHHPDKRVAAHSSAQVVDLDVLKRAFTTLSSVDLRDKYDASRAARPSGPRPAQIVSLEEFDEHEGDSTEDTFWSYDCRCGGIYRITEVDMEKDQHLIGCNSCSEVVWAGYEVAESND